MKIKVETFNLLGKEDETIFDILTPKNLENVAAEFWNFIVKMEPGTSMNISVLEDLNNETSIEE